MKKIVYAILICIIIAGIVVIATVGLKADIIYSKNVELDVYVGETFERKDIENIVNEVFPNERVIINEIEMFGDMFSVTLADTRTEDELNSKVEELVTKVNEKYETELETSDIEIRHNPKAKLSSIILPYAVTIGISMLLILVYVGIRYRKLGVVRTILTYIVSILAVEMIYLSILAIVRYPINRIVIPIGLVLLVTVVTILGFVNEKKLASSKVVEEKKK